MSTKPAEGPNKKSVDNAPLAEIPSFLSSVKDTAFEKLEQVRERLEENVDKAREELESRALSAKAQKHERYYYCASAIRPRFLACYWTTKIRAWRTGYIRILALERKQFVTLDPDSYEITNAWPYHTLRRYEVAPGNCILLEVSDDERHDGAVTKLKFRCGGDDESTSSASSLLCRLLSLKHQHERQLRSKNSHPKAQPAVGVESPYPCFVDCLRLSRKGLKTQCSILVAPHGLLEVDRLTGCETRVYPYVLLTSASFTSDDPTGIVLYFKKDSSLVPPHKQNPGRLFFVGADPRHGSPHATGRNHLIPAIQHRLDTLGMKLSMSESTSVAQWLARRRNWASPDLVGDVVVTQNVVKCTTHARFTQGSPHEHQQLTTAFGSVLVGRTLAITKNAFLIERDSLINSSLHSGAGVINCRSLKDIRCIIRHSNTYPPDTSASIDSPQLRPATKNNSAIVNTLPLLEPNSSLTIEFADGTARTYSSSQRDSLIASLLDAMSCLANNRLAFISPVGCRSYRYHGGGDWSTNDDIPSGDPRVTADSTNSSESNSAVSLHCLKRLNLTVTAADAYMEQNEHSSSKEGQRLDPVEECYSVVQACRFFHANVPTVLPALQQEKKLVTATVSGLWSLVERLLTPLYRSSHSAATNNVDNDSNVNNEDVLRRSIEVQHTLISLYQALSVLSATQIAYQSSVDQCASLTRSISLGIRVVTDVLPLYWSLRTLVSLLSSPSPAASLSSPSTTPPDLQERDRETEYVNKSVVLALNGFIPALVGQLFSDHYGSSQFVASDLVVMEISGLVENILCSSQDTTDPLKFSEFIAALSKGYRALMFMLSSTTPLITENAALLLHLLTIHSPETASLIQEQALSSGIILRHFHSAIFSPIESRRFLSRCLCALWMTGSSDCEEKRLLKRMIPVGFLGYLSMPLLSLVEEEQLDQLERGGIEEGGDMTSRNKRETISSSGNTNQTDGTNMKRLRQRIHLVTRNITTTTKSSSSSNEGVRPENFRVFFHVLTKDHALPDLIWNQQTRRELRIAVESEIQLIEAESEARGGGPDAMAWNYQQFAITYSSLKDEVQVGSVYMRLWIQAGDGFIRSWNNPVQLFELLFRRFLVDLDRDTVVTNMCIRCLERLYAFHWEKIGVFPDIMMLVRSMGVTKNIETQHRLLSLLATLLGVSEDTDKYGKINVPANAEQLLNAESMSQLCQFVAWGHTNGAQVANLLTSVVGELNNVGLLTDGSTVGPVQEPSTMSYQPSEPKVSFPNDSSSPAVWFVAPAGKIPPPSGDVSGPFRLSELVQRMNRGELHPHFLISAAHVEDYSRGDEDDDDVKEEQIDTGEWRMLQHIWQLRWQLCTDGSSNGVYGPAEVALMALRSLSRLVDLHRSVDSRGVVYFPIPIAKRLLCGLDRDPSATVGAISLPGTFDYVSTMDTQDFLPIVAQAMLCNDPKVVSNAAALLTSLMAHNDETCAKLYLTGAFFFGCAYTGSNFSSIANFLHRTHMKQQFRSGYSAAANASELSPKEQSILGGMIPEGLLLILINYGPEAFSDIFVGGKDTPEVIWSLEMRKHLVDMIRQHLGDFPQRLWQHTTTKYEYCPLPGVAYRRLEKEIFCHNYYLKNLCDEVKFPDWPIAEPVEVFRACLEKWQQFTNRDQVEEEDAMEEAWKILGLKDGDENAALRKAYRSLARKYHPDKNPAGREMFEKIQAAYELLLPLLESGGRIESRNEGSEEKYNEHNESISDGLRGGRRQMDDVHLLVKTQVLLCKRYADDIGKYKYPAYKLLFACLAIPSPREENENHDILSSCMMKSKRAEFVHTATELVYQSCLVSPLNAEELVLEGGLSVLESLLDFYIKGLTFVSRPSVSITKEMNIVSRSTQVSIITHIVRTISGVMAFENGRSAFLSLVDPSRLSINWRKCIDGTLLQQESKLSDDTALVKQHILEGLAYMSCSKELQHLHICSGVVWTLVQFMLAYDPTLEEEFHDNENAALSNVSQNACNIQAKLASRALGMLCGVMKEKLTTPPNQDLFDAMKVILTKPIVGLLRNQRSTTLLETLNSNVETPRRIWNVQMREELSKFLTKMTTDRIEPEYKTLDEELAPALSFQYSNLANEVVIGGVYVRIFNGLHGDRNAIREIPDCSNFAKELILFVWRSLKNSSNIFGQDIVLSPDRENVDTNGDMLDKDNHWFPVTDKRFVAAVTAILHLAQVDGLVDDVLCDDFSPSVLFSLLELPQESKAFDICSDILLLMCPKRAFADSFANTGELWRLLDILERPDTCEPSKDDQQKAGSLSEDNERSGGDGGSSMAFAKRQERGWIILESLASSPSIATALIESSGWLELLGIIAGYSKFTKQWAGRQGAAKAIARLLWDPNVGSSAVSFLHRLLPPTLIMVLKHEGADTMLRKFDNESETPELIWDSEMRAELRNSLKVQLDHCLDGRNSKTFSTFGLSPDFHIKYRKLQDELYVGGVYVRLFLKDPRFNLRNPVEFLEKLLLKWTQELETTTNRVGMISTGTTTSHSTSITAAGQDVLQLVTDALVLVCKVRDTLCDKLSEWGYVARSISLLNATIICELHGTPMVSTIRLIHVAASRRSNIETMAMVGERDGKMGVVDCLARAIGGVDLHPDSGFIIGAIKKIFENALGDLSKAHADSPSTLPHTHQEESIRDLRSADRQENVQNDGSDLNAIAGAKTNLSARTSGSEITKRIPYDFGSHVMAPSPAPGLEPVRRSVTDDPLSFLLDESASSQPIQGTEQQEGRLSSSAFPCHQPFSQEESHSHRIPSPQTTRGSTFSGMQPPILTAARQDLLRVAHQNPLFQGETMQPRMQQQPTNYDQGFGRQSTRTENQLRSPNPLVRQSPMQSKAGRVQAGNGDVDHSVPRVINTYRPERLTNKTSETPISHDSSGSMSYHRPSAESRILQHHTSSSGATPAHLQESLHRNDPSKPSIIPAASLSESTDNKPLQQHAQGQEPKKELHHTAAGNSLFASDLPSNSNNFSLASPQKESVDFHTQQEQQAEAHAKPVEETDSQPGAPIPLASGFIDARSSVKPTIVAEQKTCSTPGAPGCALGRVALLQTALQCDLPRFLVEKVLDNPTLSKVRDPPTTKVNSIELLKLLSSDPGYGMKFGLILDSIPGWRKYKSQDHSLFMGALEKSDYFLADGGTGSRKLLTGE